MPDEAYAVMLPTFELARTYAQRFHLKSETLVQTSGALSPAYSGKDGG